MTTPAPRRLQAAALLLAAAFGSGAAAQARAPGAGVDVAHYEVRLRPYLLGRSLSGETEITVRSLEDGLGELVFSGNALTIDAASVDGRPVRAEVRDGAWVFPLPRPLPRGRTAVLKASYHGIPKRGLTFRPRSTHTGYFACDWMICAQDRPGDKASLGLSLQLPAGMTSVASGRPVAKRRLPSGEELHVWREARPYSPYLFGFAAGEFTRAADRAGSVELAYLSDAATEAELKPLFAPTANMLRWFEAKAGVPFPHPRYTQVLVKGGAAQEASSFSMIGRAFLDPILTTPQEDWVVAHELAHQWWGNLVTCESLSEFWLNEGVTTFMVAAWKEGRWGRAAYDREMDIARRGRERAAAAGFDKPLSWAGEYPSLGVRRAVQYDKGALFMDALRRELGDPVFWAGLKRFTRAHAGGTATSRDFQRAFETESGRDLQPLFAAWVY